MVQGGADRCGRDWLVGGELCGRRSSRAPRTRLCIHLDLQTGRQDIIVADGLPFIRRGECLPGARWPFQPAHAPAGALQQTHLDG